MSLRPPDAAVLFDEAHSQAWTIRADLAARMQPSHPADSSYDEAARRLREQGLECDAHLEGPLGEGALARADVLVIAHPSEPAWEATIPGGASPRLTEAEMDAIERFVAAGGGLVVLGETEQDKYANNLNDLVQRFGVTIENTTVSDYEHHHIAPHWVLAHLQPALGIDFGARVGEACFYRSATLACDQRAHPIAVASPTASRPGASLAAVAEHGEGRVVVLADSDLFGDDCIGELDNGQLWRNLVGWAAGGGLRRTPPRARIEPAGSPHWATLKGEVDSLRLLQESDGRVDLGRHDSADLDAHVEAIASAVAALAPAFAHQADYLEAVVADLRSWAAAGYGIPDFSTSLDRFRPDLRREDGIHHLVLFPMYKQNGSRDRVFEALIVGVPWPGWLAELERSRYDNAKFVPVTLVDNTAGYEGECAVLFPETVTASATANHFGAIFCDREAARFRDRVGRAVSLLGLDLPPDTAALLSSERLSQDAYELWDLIHDRAHSHGDLPFDPFMIRQRMPYWMYALEELRCDLTAFDQAVVLEREGFAFAGYVQLAILFDRLFRFPVTGPRTRNYDGLGGQLLFGFLHAHGCVHWTDNRLSIDWDRIQDGVLELRERIEGLYRAGIRRSKVGHWAAAHDLVAEYVPPSAQTRWAAGVRQFADVPDPRPYVDAVLDDEFPLSLFYSALARKLDQAAEPIPAG